MKQLTGQPVSEDQIKILDEYFYRLMMPKNYFGGEGVGVKYDKDFEDTCVIMSQYISHNPKLMLTIEYFQTLERLKKQTATNGR